MTNEELQAMLAAAYGGRMMQNYPVREPYPGELDYFKQNPHVSGMAAEDNQVTLNPFSGLSSQQQQAVIANERARIHMRSGQNRPAFDLSPEQAAAFGSYGGGDPQAQRETIAARIFSGDQSAGNATPEQIEWVKSNLGINPANMGLNAEPRSEWDSYKYNQANIGRTAGEVEPKSMGWGEYAQEWYDRLIGTPLKGMAGAGDALLGRSNPDLESFEKNVLDALSLYAGPSVAKSTFGKLPSQNTLNIFGGVGAKDAPLRMKEIAEKALAAGKDPDEVWKYTGWKPGMEGKMRFEIDDRAMKFTPEAQASFTEQKGMQGLFKAGADLREGVPLRQAIDHPDLFKQYPELEGVTLKADHPNGGGASFDEKTMTIHVPKEGVMLGQQNSYLDSITHEIQHWVQKKEDFARGGTTGVNRPSSEMVIDAIALAEKDGKDWSKIKQSERWSYYNDVAFKDYQNLAGEIEARDAANRRTWDTDMRRAVPPDMRDDAIIRMGDNTDYKAFVADVLKELNY